MYILLVLEYACCSFHYCMMKVIGHCMCCGLCGYYMNEIVSPCGSLKSWQKEEYTEL
jgi:hypothetical protein